MNPRNTGKARRLRSRQTGVRGQAGWAGDVAALRQAVADAGGEEVKSLGDGLMVAFGSVLAALGCAVAMQRRVAEHNRAGSGPALEVRVGLHAGEPVRDGGDFHGEAVVVAKRLCDLAAWGQIFTSELVTNLVGSPGGFSFRPLWLQLKAGRV
jgi:class 3 adenylate cyclase